VRFSDQLHKRSEVEILVRKNTESNHLDIVESEMQRIGQLTSSLKENTMCVFSTLDDILGSDNLVAAYVGIICDTVSLSALQHM